MAKTCFKMLKDNCCRLVSLSLEAFACVEVWPHGHDGSVLLSVVAQALLLTIVCRSFPSLFSSKAVDDRFLSDGFHIETHRRCRDAEEGSHL
jgi:hypothetical protein